mmetsp:Transcript_75188/g.149293  ORF Transcript_75188/g.149293 Transcript_75188/m.149293 type:complete len:497 (-) Transcript_75188:583-2073(-)
MPPPPPPMPFGSPAGKKGPALRALHWIKVPPMALEGTVWQDLPQAMELDADELRRLFTVKAVEPKASTRNLLGAKSKKTMLLDLKRSNQICIALAKFKGTHAQVRDALLRLDDGMIKSEDIPKLRNCVPTDEEKEMLTPYMSSDTEASKLEKAEIFLLYMARVPRLSQRLDCFHTKLTLPTRLADTSAQIDAINSAGSSVRASKLLPQLLALVLAAGNVLNAGTMRGNARGFHLETLQKLAATKSGSVEPQVSLLHHIAKVASVKAPDVHKTLKHELKAVEEAVAIKCTVLESEVASLRHELEAVQSELPLVEKANEIDRFPEAMAAFLAECATKVDQLVLGMEAMRSSLAALSRFLGDASDANEPELVLQRIHAFAISFQKACRDNERAAFLKTKTEKDAREKAERVQKAQAMGVAAQASSADMPADDGNVSRRKMPLRTRQAGPGAMMGSIQGSLRRGDFKGLKQLRTELQSQWNQELAGRLASRRSLIDGDGT